MTAKLSDKEAQVLAWCSVLERTDRIVTGQNVVVSPVSAVPPHLTKVAGWTNGRTIFVNETMMRDMFATKPLVDAVISLKGLNYHELSHILYSPRESDDVVVRMRQETSYRQGVPKYNIQQLWYAYNALEDQRIESLFAARFTPSRRYFEAMILQWVLDHGTSTSAVLTHGRKYLSPKLRIQADDLFVQVYGRELLNKFKAVVDDYLTVVYPRDTMKALMLIKKFADLSDELAKKQGTLPNLPVGDNNGNLPAMAADKQAEGTMHEGRPSRSATEEASKSLADQEDAKKAEGVGGGASDNDEDTEHHVMTEDEMDDSLGDKSVEDLFDAAKEDLDSITEDEAVQDDIDTSIKSAQAEIRKMRGTPGGITSTPTETRTPTDDEWFAIRRVKTALEKLRQDAEPTIVHRQNHGRIDMRRVLVAKPGELDNFRAYDNGTEEETSVEAVVLMDISGSMMGQPAVDASTAVWVLKKAFDKLDIRTTVLAYDSHHQIIYRPEDTAPVRIQVISSAGATNPASAFVEADRIFRFSDRKNLVLATVTDGAWQGESEWRPEIARIHKNRNVSSCVMYVNCPHMRSAEYGETPESLKRGHQHSIILNKVGDVSKAVGKMVEQIISDRLQGID